MKLNNLPSEFQKALPILQKIRKAGHEAYFVGGSVRDVLLNRPIHDVDIATSSYPEETKKIFNRTIDIGIEHGTVLVLEGNNEYEITTFRTEDIYVDYRRPSHVSFVRSLEEDLKRRDFTINAFALDETGLVIDKFDGLADLQKKRLRAVGNPTERFNEDALRIMRGFRFVGSLGFDIESDTFMAMTTYAPLLEKISIERLFIELDKLLLSPFWRKGVKAMMTAKAHKHLPHLSNATDALQQLLDDLVEDFQFKSSEQAWAALLIALNVKNSHTFLKTWKTSSQFQKKVETIVRIYRFRLTNELSRMALYRYGITLIEQAEDLRRGFGLQVDFERIKRLDNELTIHDRHDIVVNGSVLINELHFQPGPVLGQILKNIEQEIVLGDLNNDKQAIFEYIRKEKS